MRVAVVIPVLNHLAYTRGCLDCLRADIAGGVRVIVVDNGSSDGTKEWLAGQANITVIRNEENLGCAPAWNQGVAAAIARAGVPQLAGGRSAGAPDREAAEPKADWIVLLNNDVLLPEDWLTALLNAAGRHRLDIVCPAMRERDLNYEFRPYARDYMARLANVIRRNGAHGVCFAVKRAVFEKIGRFDEEFRIGQFEDSDFFRRARLAGFRTGIVGACFIHHFGSVTQDALTDIHPDRPYEAENRAYYIRKWNISWGRRRWEKTVEFWQSLWWRTSERLRFGHTLHEKWTGGTLRQQ